jgi:hypothetical protein
LAVLAIAVLAYGGYCLVEMASIREQVKHVPRMTCQQLVQHGPGTHRHVTLTDVSYGSGRAVAERDGDTGALEMYLPIWSARREREPRPGDIALLLCVMDEGKRRRIRDDRKQRELCGQPGISELTGAVREGAEGLPPWAREGLARQHPGIPLARCWVLTVGLDEPTEGRARRMMWQGIVSILAAGAVLAGWAWWRRTRVANDAREMDVQEAPA